MSEMLFEYPSAFLPGPDGRPSNHVDFHVLRTLVNSGDIRVSEHPDPSVPYAIYNYAAIHAQRGSDAQTSPYAPVIDVCRGLIANTETGLVVARPFERMDQLGENDELPGPGTWYRKIDGTLAIQYSEPSGRQRIASRGTFDNSRGTSNRYIEFGNEMLDRYAAENEFDPSITHLWEMVVPGGDYTIEHEPGMTLIGRVVTATGVELDLPDQSEVSYPVVDVLEGEDFTSATRMRKLDMIDCEGAVVKLDGSGKRIKVKTNAYRWLTMQRNGEVPRYMRDKLVNGGTFAGMIGRVPPSVRPMMKEHADTLQAEIDAAMAPIKAVLRGEADRSSLDGKQMEILRTMELGGDRAALKTLIRKPPRRQARSQRDTRQQSNRPTAE